MPELHEIVGTYDYRLVALSVAIAIFASYAALDLAGRVRASRGLAHSAWLSGGAVAMGGGIWSMHYTGMLAFRLPIHVYYHLPTVVLSLVAAIAASLIALYVVSRPQMTTLHVIAGSILMGAGIATMHYTGMAAMRLAAMHHYQRGLFLLSIVLAVLIASAALWLTYHFQKESRGRKAQIAIAIVMGLAIPVMHYTGMAAVRYEPIAGMPDLSHAVDISTLAHSAVILVTVLILGFAVLTSLVDRRLTAQARELALSEQRYQLLFESNPHPSFVFDLDTLHPLAANQAVVETYGFTAEEFRALKVTALQVAQNLEVLLKPDKSGKETQHVRKDGAAIDVEVRVSNITWDGKPAALLLVNNITERKQAERERDKMEVQLRQAQKLESIGQLAAGIAHEINTPIQYIGDNLRFLGDAFRDLRNVLAEYERMLAGAKNGTVSQESIQLVAKALETAAADYLLTEIPLAIQQSIEGVGRVSTLVSAMKEFSHPGGKEKSPLNLNKAIENTVIVTRNEWKYVADLETDYDPSLPPVSCLPGEFNQVILNLIVNAAHAIAAAPGRTQKGKIRVCTRNCENWAEIRVEDSGAGIAKDIRDRIFDPFFTTKDVGKGTGQGLAIARSVIVEKHNGSIHFETEEGKGTAFIVRLPHDGKTLSVQAAAV